MRLEDQVAIITGGHAESGVALLCAWRKRAPI